MIMNYGCKGLAVVFALFMHRRLAAIQSAVTGTHGLPATAEGGHEGHCHEGHCRVGHCHESHCHEGHCREGLQRVRPPAG